MFLKFFHFSLIPTKDASVLKVKSYICQNWVPWPENLYRDIHISFHRNVEHHPVQIQQFWIYSQANIKIGFSGLEVPLPNTLQRAPLHTQSSVHTGEKRYLIIRLYINKIINSLPVFHVLNFFDHYLILGKLHYTPAPLSVLLSPTYPCIVISNRVSTRFQFLNCMHFV